VRGWLLTRGGRLEHLGMKEMEKEDGGLLVLVLVVSVVLYPPPLLLQELVCWGFLKKDKYYMGLPLHMPMSEGWVPFMFVHGLLSGVPSLLPYLKQIAGFQPHDPASPSG
jgi:hypothetical protein